MAGLIKCKNDDMTASLRGSTNVRQTYRHEVKGAREEIPFSCVGSQRFGLK